MNQQADPVVARVCARIGAEYSGPFRQEDDWNTRMRSYALIGNRARAEWGQIDYLQVRRSGNFGNNVIQLIHALTLAEQFGIPRVLHKVDGFSDSRSTVGPRLIGGRGRMHRNKAGLAGTWFLAAGNSTLATTPPDRFLRIVDSYLKPNFVLKPNERGGICLNIRGGYDVFENPTPNGRYGQPPLSYYQTALTHILDQHGEMPIEIVHQDERNPVLAPLAGWISAQGLRATMSSGGPEADARAILAARHLIIGWTSFSASLALLSPNIESLTIFRATQLQEVLRRALPRLYLCEDRAQAYFGQTRWRNTDPQRAMMLDYPAENLEFTDIALKPERIAERIAGYRLRRAARFSNLLARMGLRR